MASLIGKIFKRKEDKGTSDVALSLNLAAIGLPPSPTCIAVDASQSLLAVGAKGGVVSVYDSAPRLHSPARYGQHGISCTINLSGEEDLVQVAFLVNMVCHGGKSPFDHPGQTVVHDGKYSLALGSDYAARKPRIHAFV